MSTTRTTQSHRCNETPPKRFFWFSYATNPSRDLRRNGLDIHKTRDGGMLADLAVSLHARGFQYGGSVLNLPPDYAAELREERRLICGQEDFIILPTRPPLNDAESEGRRGIVRSDTNEEKEVFALLHQHVFRFLDRSRAILLPALTANWDAKTKQYAEAHFQIYGLAHVIKLYAEQVPKDAFSLGYLVCTRGPDFRFLTAFGMSGTMTALWGELLRSVYAADLQSWIRSSADRLVICRIAPPEKYPYPVFSYDLDQISHEIVVDATFSTTTPPCNSRVEGPQFTRGRLSTEDSKSGDGRVLGPNSARVPDRL